HKTHAPNQWDGHHKMCPRTRSQEETMNDTPTPTPPLTEENDERRAQAEPEALMRARQASKRKVQDGLCEEYALAARAARLSAGGMIAVDIAKELGTTKHGVYALLDWARRYAQKDDCSGGVLIEGQCRRPTTEETMSEPTMKFHPVADLFP